MDNLKRLEPHQGDGYLMSVEPTENQPQSVIAEFHHVNKKMILQDKSFLCDQIFLNQKSLKISEVDLTSKDRDLKPYWDDFCKGINLRLWLPTKIDWQDSEQNSSNFLLKKTVENSWFLTKTMQAPKENLYKICLPSSLFFRAGCTDLEDTLRKSKKIRIYPTSKQKNLFSQWFGTSRFTFNETAKYLKIPNTKASWKSIKTDLIKSLPDWAKDIPYQIKSIAVRDCCNAVKNAKVKFKITNKFQGIKFRSKKDPQQSCFIPKSAISDLGIYHTLSEKLKFSESLPNNILDARLIKNNGRYYVVIPYESTILKSENQGRIVALDPGIRTFLTFYSERFCGKLGDGDFKRIFRLCKVLDKLQSMLSDKTLTFFKRSRLKKSAGRLRWKIKDLISELHHKSALFLVKNFDVIFLPTFEVKEMTNRFYRKIGSKSARQMLTLCHFKFKQFIKHKAFEYGKTVVDVCEAYTSKTVSWTGEIINNLGGRKIIKSKIDGQKMDRDLNGARGIFLRALGDSPIFRDYLEDKLMVKSTW